MNWGKASIFGFFHWTYSRFYHCFQLIHHRFLLEFKEWPCIWTLRTQKLPKGPFAKLVSSFSPHAIFFVYDKCTRTVKKRSADRRWAVNFLRLYSWNNKLWSARTKLNDPKFWNLTIFEIDLLKNDKAFCFQTLGIMLFLPILRIDIHFKPITLRNMKKVFDLGIFKNRRENLIRPLERAKKISKDYKKQK